MNTISFEIPEELLDYFFVAGKKNNIVLLYSFINQLQTKWEFRAFKHISLVKIILKRFAQGRNVYFFYTYFTIKNKLYHIKGPMREKAETANLSAGPCPN